MKLTCLFPVLLIVGGLLIAGCGKSADQIKMEGDLSKEITVLHDGAMAKITQANDLSTRIGEVMAQHDNLVKKYPKEAAGHSSDDLKAAMEQIVKAKSSMDAWMKGYKPYDPAVKHAEAMKALTTHKTDLTKMKADIEGAITAATTAVESHTKVASELMAKMSKKKH